MAREWAKKFYNSKEWKRVRTERLRIDRYKCQAAGCRRTAEEVHHKIELTEKNVTDPKIAININNLVSLCSDCHKRITKEQKRKYSNVLQEIYFDENGYPLPISPPDRVVEKF